MFNKYPYTDFHELNLDWIIYQIKKIHAEWTEYQVLNHITFRGIWDISEQYPAWSIVTDNNVGFVSIKPVPAGIEITNADYWIKICDYSQVIEDFNDRIANLESVITLGNSNLYVSFVNGDDSFAGWNTSADGMVMIPMSELLTVLFRHLHMQDNLLRI